MLGQSLLFLELLLIYLLHLHLLLQLLDLKVFLAELLLHLRVLGVAYLRAHSLNHRADLAEHRLVAQFCYVDK